ncbi:MAG: LysM peptidoglycan-binding domain-containing protein [Deltaproteobacteria bacterium]|nr:LysM peptidoglycan-binding domain-containing protein [Deltaproteobacteria bacterium]
MTSPTRILALTAVFLLVVGGCAIPTQQTATRPDATRTPPAQKQSAERLTDEEIANRVVQELKELGEQEVVQEQAPREEATGEGGGEEQVTYDIPITINDQVEFFLDFFQNRIPKRFSMWLSRSGRYLPMMRSILKEKGLPEDLVYLALIESGFSCQAYSVAHAVGPWQFIRSTGRRYGLEINYWVDERRDPVKSTRAAAAYLSKLFEQFGSWYLAAAAYNAGEAKIQKALDRYKAEDFWSISQSRQQYLKKETKQYVPKMIAAALIAKDPAKYGFPAVDYQEPLAYDEVQVDPGTSLAVAAKLAGINSSDLKDLNPELRRWCTPPTAGVYTLRIPQGGRASFETAYASLPSSARQARLQAPPHQVTVQSGDTLQRIASLYRVNLSDLRAMNTHLDPRRLQVGQRVVLPGGSAQADDDDEDQASARSKVRLASKSREQRALKVDTYPPGRRGSQKITVNVAKGDSLWTIAQNYNLDHRQIRRWNGLKSSQLSPGQSLVLYVPQAKAEAKVADSGPRPQVTKAGGRIVYYVQRGDNLWQIAQAHGVTTRDIKRWNKLRSSQVAPGHKLVLYLPGTSSSGAKGGKQRELTYLVRRGDTLWEIGRRFQVSPQDLKRWNSLRSSRLNVGDRLTVRR